MQYFENPSDNQGRKSLDRLSFFSSIHPVTALKLIFVDYEMESLPRIRVSKCNSPFPPPVSMLSLIVESVPARCGSTLKWGAGKITGNYALVVQHFRP